MDYMDFSNSMAVRAFAGGQHRSDTYPFINVGNHDLSNKSVCITGASRGIGSSIAVAFAAAGCPKIALAARGPLGSVAALCKAAAINTGKKEPLIIELNMDVTSEHSVKSAAEVVGNSFGGSLDVLINNAGYSESPGRISDDGVETKDWWKTWQVNVEGVYLCCREFMPLLLRSNSKTICNLTSGAALAISGLASAYGGSKFAICRFGEHLATQYKKEGLLVHSVEPGAVETDMAEKLHEDFRPYLQDTPELAAHTLVWLVKERKEWLSPRWISCNWDMEGLVVKKDAIIEGDLLRFKLAI